MRIRKKDIGRWCVVEFVDEESENGIIVEATVYPEEWRIYFPGWQCTYSAENSQIVRLGKRLKSLKVVHPCA